MAARTQLRSGQRAKFQINPSDSEAKTDPKTKVCNRIGIKEYMERHLIGKQSELHTTVKLENEDVSAIDLDKKVESEIECKFDPKLTHEDDPAHIYVGGIRNYLNPTQFLDVNINGDYKNAKSSKIAKDCHKRNNLLVTNDENDEEIRRKLKKIKRAEYLKKYELRKAPIPCYYCTYSCKGMGQLNRHVKEVHEKIAKFHCDKCSRTFTRQSGVNTHMNRVHQNPKPKKMNDERRLIMNKPLTCTQCEFSCFKTIQMNRHLKSKHLGIKFECDSCNQVFSRFENINRHKRDVHPTVKEPYWKPFSCQECGYTCTRKDGLKKHIKDVHTEKREYKCHECLESFKTKATLNNHVMYVHTVMKNFGCHQCEYMAKTKKVLERHVMAVHDKIKNYKCDACHFATALKHTLKAHVRNVHGKN